MGVVTRIVIVGAGASGLAMLHHLLRNQTPYEIHMVDPDFSSCENKTWCQWIHPADRQPYHTHVWPAIDFRSPTVYRRQSHADLLYAHTHGAAYRAHVEQMDKGPHRVNWIKDRVRAFDYESQSGASVHLEKGRLQADWVFTSWYPGRASRIPLWQQFHGWVVETAEDRFDTGGMSLMDFDVPQIEGRPTFGYVLPFDPRKALIEITGFAPREWRTPVYERALSHYLESRMGLNRGDYEITGTESGRIPMGYIPFPGQPNPATFPIGTIAGAVKPTTGYAFSRIQETCAHLAQSLGRTGRPAYPPATHYRFRYYDRLLVDILLHQPQHSVRIFSDLFGKVEMNRIFRFLDESTTFCEEAALFARLPKRPFLASAWRHLF